MPSEDLPNEGHRDVQLEYQRRHACRVLGQSQHAAKHGGRGPVMKEKLDLLIRREEEQDYARVHCVVQAVRAAEMLHLSYEEALPWRSSQDAELMKQMQARKQRHAVKQDDKKHLCHSRTDVPNKCRTRTN